MQIRFACQGCQKNIRAPLDLAGKEFSCPACGTKQTVPAAPEEAADEGTQEDAGGEGEAHKEAASTEDKPAGGEAAATRAPATSGGALNSPLIEGVLAAAAIGVAVWALLASPQGAAPADVWQLQTEGGAPDVTVRIDAANRLHLDGETFDGPARLADALAGRAAGRVQAVVDEDALWASVTSLVQALGRAGVGDVQLTNAGE